MKVLSAHRWLFGRIRAGGFLAEYIGEDRSFNALSPLCFFLDCCLACEHSDAFGIVFFAVWAVVSVAGDRYATAQAVKNHVN